MSLATKYRPKDFGSVVEQTSTKRILQQQVDTGTFGNTYLFCGPSGDGKTTIARIFAGMINHGLGEPIEIDGASNNGVDNVRSIIDDAKARALDAEYKTFIVDECFTGDTLVNTSDGLKRIEDIVPGDRVMTLTGFNNVTYVHCKEVGNSMLNLVRLSNGKTINTTADHLFLTTKGWVESKNLTKGDILLDAKNMSELWKSIPDKAQRAKILQQQMPDGVSGKKPSKGFSGKNLSYLWNTLLCGKSKQSKENLLSSMQGKVNISIREDNNELRIWDGTKETIILKNDGSQSDEEFTKYRENALSERIEWDSASVEGQKRGKWVLYRTSTKAMEGIRGFLGSGVSSEGWNLEKQPKQISFIIQSRPWLSREKACSRGGWQFTSLEKYYCSRYEKDYMSESVRVESVEIFQPRDNGESRQGLTKNTKLYDLTVEGSPTYFANGVLVHNCHMITNAGWNAFLKCLEEPPKYTIFIFCTTDPQKIPATIVNRLMRFNLTKISTEGIRNRLEWVCSQEGYSNFQDACDLISKMANGGMRDGLALLEKCAGYSKDLSIQNVLQAIGNFSYETYFRLVNALVDNDKRSILSIVDEVYDSGKDIKLFIEQFLEFCLDLNKYCLFKDISITKIPAYLEKPKERGDTMNVAFAVGFDGSTKFFGRIVSRLLELKVALKYDTMPKTTASIRLMEMSQEGD